MLRKIRAHLDARRSLREARPIFVISPPRSGSTLLGRVLGAHPDVFLLSEPWEIWQEVADLSASDQPTGFSLRSRIHLAHRYGLLARQQPGKSLVVKDPRDAVRLPQLHAAIPFARFVMLRRDPLDTIASIFEASSNPDYVTDRELDWCFTRIPGYKQLASEPAHIRAAHIWRASESGMREGEKLIADASRFNIQYESLVEQPAPEIQRLLDFLGLKSTAEVNEALSAVSNKVEKAVRFEKDSFQHSDLASGDAGSGTTSTGTRIGRASGAFTEEQKREVLEIVGRLS